MGIYNTEYFKKRAQDIHYDKFDYSEAIYINSTTKINIICKIHGCFAQTPSNHFKYGCNKCGYEQSSLKQKSNIEIFIRESNVIHNLKFDYSESIYVNEKTKIIIICPFHGRFEQCPVYHKQGQGCPKCGKISSKNKLCKKHNVFIKESELIQKIKYDYSETVYINSHSKVTIICPIHGKFDQLAKSHINGVGCPKCFGTPLSTKEEFIIKANKIHEYKYNYEHVFYTGNKIKVIIVCPNHGEFLQKPNSHLTGQGCPMCKESKGEQTIRKFFLENSIIFNRQYKEQEISVTHFWDCLGRQGCCLLALARQF